MNETRRGLNILFVHVWTRTTPFVLSFTHEVRRSQTEPDGALKQLTFHSENSPDVWDIVRAINVVKNTLKAIDDEYYDYIIRPDIDPNAHEKTDNKVFEQLQSAENIIHPGDDWFEKFVLSLAKTSHDPEVNSIDDFKEVVDVLIKIDEAKIDKANISD